MRIINGWIFFFKRCPWELYFGLNIFLWAMNSSGTGKTKTKLSGEFKFVFLMFQRKVFLDVLDFFLMSLCSVFHFFSACFFISQFLTMTNVAPAPCSGGIFGPAHLKWFGGSKCLWSGEIWAKKTPGKGRREELTLPLLQSFPPGVCWAAPLVWAPLGRRKLGFSFIFGVVLWCVMTTLPQLSPDRFWEGRGWTCCVVSEEI